MGPEENKAIVRRIVDEAWNEQDLDVIDELYSDGYVGHWYLPGGEDSDREDLKGFMQEVFDGFANYEMNLEFLVAEDDLVTAGFTSEGDHEGEFMGIPPSETAEPGNPTPGHATYRIEDGQVVEAWSTWDALGLMQELGALPEDLSSVALSADD
ncbi:ester cyclase [Halobellus sp. Atlit-31R]|nr:ester cyclase [Halobellus sp. Atlit-31R]